MSSGGPLSETRRDAALKTDVARCEPVRTRSRYNGAAGGSTVALPYRPSRLTGSTASTATSVHVKRINRVETGRFAVDVDVDRVRAEDLSFYFWFSSDPGHARIEKEMRKRIYP